MDRETQSVLQMLRDGKITPEQADDLLEALDSAAPSPPPLRASKLHISVTNTWTGRSTVNVNIPFGLVEVASRMGLRLGLKQVPGLADVNFDEIVTAIKGGASGRIVDIDDDEDYQHVVVAVE